MSTLTLATQAQMVGKTSRLNEARRLRDLFAANCRGRGLLGIPPRGGLGRGLCLPTDSVNGVRAHVGASSAALRSRAGDRAGIPLRLLMAGCEGENPI